MMREDITIITGSREEYLAPLLCSWLASPNAGKWAIRIADIGQTSSAFRAAASAIPHVAFLDLRSEFAASRRRYPHSSIAQQSYITKVAALLQCPTRWAFWLDHDCEVLGDLSPIAEHAIASGRWLAAPSYASFGMRKRIRRHATQNAAMVVDTHAPELRTWYETMHAWPDDEESLCAAFGGRSGVQKMICNINRREWYLAPNHFPEINRGIHPAVVAMGRHANTPGAPLPAILHWGSPTAKPIFQARFPAWTKLTEEK